MASQKEPGQADEERVDVVPRWVTPELIEQTIRVWQPRYGLPLTDDDAVQLILTASRLGEVLKS
jgi:hypothetical protein